MNEYFFLKYDASKLLNRHEKTIIINYYSYDCDSREKNYFINLFIMKHKIN